MGAIVNFSHLLLIFYLLVIPLSQAEQIRFSKKDLGDKIQFNYQWLDIDKQEQNLRFVLAKSAVFDRFRQFKSYKSEFSEAYIHKELKTCIQEKPLKGVKVSFEKLAGHTYANVTGKSPDDVNAAYGEIKKLQTKFLDQYLAQNNYQRFKNFNGVNAIRPNHVAIAAQSTKDLTVLKKLILDKVAVKIFVKLLILFWGLCRVFLTQNYNQGLPHLVLVSCRPYLCFIKTKATVTVKSH